MIWDSKGNEKDQEIALAKDYLSRHGQVDFKLISGPDQEKPDTIWMVSGLKVGIEVGRLADQKYIEDMANSGHSPINDKIIPTKDDTVQEKLVQLIEHKNGHSFQDLPSNAKRVLAIYNDLFWVSFDAISGLKGRINK